VSMYSVYWLSAPHHTDYNTEGYVGISKNVEHRWKCHSKNTNTHLTRAIQKYGWDNIIKKVLVSGVDEEAALLIEEMLRPTTQIGWNIAIGGGSLVGIQVLPTKEQIEKIRIALTGKKRTEEHKINYSKSKLAEKNPMFGKFGIECVNFKYVMEATCIETGKVTLLYGGKHIREMGFDDKKVYTCANGKRKSHRGHTFKRITNGE
jgi:group I intron endonuclease